MEDISTYLCDEEILDLHKEYNLSKKILHIQRVTYYSNLLVKLLSEFHFLDVSDINMLKYSSLLHDIGYYIDKKKHHKHSKYIVLNHELFKKLPHAERNILAILVGSHRKKLDKTIVLYTKKEQRKILELISILRLADALDYGKDHIIDNMYIRNNFLYVNPTKYPNDKDFKKLLTKSQLFEDIFNLKVEFK